MSSHGHASTFLSRQLAPTVSISSDVFVSQRSTTEHGFVPGICSQLGQIRASSQSKVFFSFLGARFCLEEGLIGPSLDRLTRLVTLIQRMLSARSASARQNHSILGQKESMARLLPDGRAHKRMLQWCIKDRWSQADQSWNFHIALGPWFNKAVIQWLNRDFLFTMVPLCRPQPDLFLFTDVSLVGWGAHMGDLSASGLWSAYWQTQHINVLELRAVMLALKSFRQIIRTVIFCCQQTIRL